MSQTSLIFLVILVAIAAFVVIQVQAAKRRQTLAAWALSHGLEFHSAHDDSLGDRHPHFACLNRGDHRYADNVMEGQIEGHRVCAFDYHYETSNGDDKTRHHLSAVIVTTNLPLKPLVIRHRNFLDQVAAAVGFEGIQFEWTEFNKEFHVTSSDHRWAFDVLPQATMEFLMNSPKFTLEFQLCQVMAYRNALFQPADFDSAIQVVEGILRRLPPSLVKELRGVEE